MKIILILIAVAMLSAAGPARAMPTLYAQAIIPTAYAAEPSKAPSFEQSQEWGKLGESLQKAWKAAKESGDMSQSYKCFVRVRSPFDPGDRDFLQSKGFNVRLAAGNVVRGSVTAQDLPEVAKLYFVKKINLATED